MIDNCFLRSQKTAGFQKDCGMHSAVSGMSLNGLMAGQSVGFSANPRAIELQKKTAS